MTGYTNERDWGNEARVFKDMATAMFDVLDKLIPSVQPTKLPVVGMLSFAEVVRYFAEQQPNEFGIEAGALLKRPSARGAVIYQLFLDAKDRICVDGRGRPIGRVFVAQSLDDELASKFGKTDLIIFR